MMGKSIVLCVAALALCFSTPNLAFSQSKPRARDLGVPFDGTPGALDAITDVNGVEVGHATLISGNGKLEVGKGPVRTGVTAILPRGKNSTGAVFAGWFSLNGNGEMTGTTWVEESGFLEGPVMITNTHSVGVVRDSVIAWRVEHGQPAESEYWWSLPVVAETYDGYLNDVNGFHVKREHVFEALANAHSGRVEEGNVGGGTGMICYGFKGGIGTASRALDEKTGGPSASSRFDFAHRPRAESRGGPRPGSESPSRAKSRGGYTVGVLVQCNCGARDLLRIAGVPVGREIGRDPGRAQAARPEWDDRGSIIIVVATDAPLLPHQLKRLARRASLGLARTGSISSNGSGDIFIAFSTANPDAARPKGIRQLQMVPNDEMSPLFQATVEATEEAVVNALVAAETMTGADNHTVHALPHDRLREVLKNYNRLR